MLNPEFITLITPSRWFSADAQDGSFIKLREFVKANLQKKYRKMFTIIDSANVFPNTSIAGGVNYFLVDNKFSGDVEFYENNKPIPVKRPLFENGIEIIIDSNEKVQILHNVIKKVENNGYLTQMTTGRDAFGFVGQPNNVEKNSKSNAFADCGTLRTKDGIRYINKSIIQKNVEIFKAYKVFTSKGDGAAGIIGERQDKPARIIGKNYIASPYDACTDTYIPIGCFDNKTEAENLSKYLKTKFLRFMVGIMKTSQNIYQPVYSFVPLQDFTEKSDIDWSKPIVDIDKQLYKKYDLAQEQIDYIEKMIAEMK